MNNKIDYLNLGTSNKRKETYKDHLALRSLMKEKWTSIRDFSHNSADQIIGFQFKRVKQMVSYAFDNVILYREKYSAVGFQPGDLKTWADFERLPILTKDELINGFPEKTISKVHNTEFTTRSSGSSGRFVTLAVSPEAVYIDTIQGARQFYFQSGGDYTSTDLALFIYTSPWWVSSIDGEYRSEFIPTTYKPNQAIERILQLQPKIMSVYPTYLKMVMRYVDQLSNSGIGLIVTHSEQSNPHEREAWSNSLGIMIRDEFSSEELTRIALECPYSKYHLEEDACYVEIVNPHDTKLLTNSQPGLIVGTNLLNEATPVIRYSQGDLATILGRTSCSCGSNFRVIESPNGRYMDSIVVNEQEFIPASCFMDLAYNWYLELDVPVHGLQYQIIQNKTGNIDIFLVKGSYELSPSQKMRIQNSLYQLIPREMEVKVHDADRVPINGGAKYRPVISLMKKTSFENESKL